MNNMSLMRLIIIYELGIMSYELGVGGGICKF